MERYSREQRIQIIQIHYRNNENYTDTCRELRALYGNNEAPSRQIIMKLIKNFESVGHVGDVKTPIRPGKVKSGKTIRNVIERLAENQADRANELDTTANSDRLDELQSAVSPTEGSLCNKGGGNDTNDTATPDDNNDSSTSKGNNENQLRTSNSISVSKASRNTKKPRRR